MRGNIIIQSTETVQKQKQTPNGRRERRKKYGGLHHCIFHSGSKMDR